MSYSLDNSKELLIYGARKEYVDKADILQQSGYKVLAFFDQNASNLKIKYPIYKLGEEPFSEEKKKKLVVIIALQNGLQHDKVAKNLYENGYKQILFLPMDYSNQEKCGYMRQAFNSFWNYGFHPIEDVPDLEELSKNEDFLMIKSFKDMVTLRIPTWLVFSENNIPLINFNSYIELYSMLSSGKGQCEAYIKYLENYGWSREKILEDRSSLCEIYEKKFNEGLDFFIDSAPRAKWNFEKEYFNLKDGHNRATYLWTKGYIRIPITIHKSEYDKIKSDLIFLEKNWRPEVEKIGISILQFFWNLGESYSALDTTVYAEYLELITRTVLLPRKENYEVLIVDNLTNLNRICKNTKYVVVIYSNEEYIDTVYESSIGKYVKIKELFTYYSDMKQMQVEVYEKKEILNEG